LRGCLSRHRRSCGEAQALEYFLDYVWILNGGNDLHLASTPVAGLDVDPKCPLYVVGLVAVVAEPPRGRAADIARGLAGPGRTPGLHVPARGVAPKQNASRPRFTVPKAQSYFLRDLE